MTVPYLDAPHYLSCLPKSDEGAECWGCICGHPATWWPLRSSALLAWPAHLRSIANSVMDEMVIAGGAYERRMQVCLLLNRHSWSYRQIGMGLDISHEWARQLTIEARGRKVDLHASER